MAQVRARGWRVQYQQRPPGGSERSCYGLDLAHPVPLGGARSPEPHRESDGRMAEAGGPESAAARCLEESSDSEPEQEPGTPQKLIRKVSTSGQIRSKVTSAAKAVPTGGSDVVSVFIWGVGGRSDLPGPVLLWANGPSPIPEPLR